MFDLHAEIEAEFASLNGSLRSMWDETEDWFWNEALEAAANEDEAETIH